MLQILISTDLLVQEKYFSIISFYMNESWSYCSSHMRVKYADIIHKNIKNNRCAHTHNGNIRGEELGIKENAQFYSMQRIIYILIENYNRFVHFVNIPLSFWYTWHDVMRDDDASKWNIKKIWDTLTMK